jgi:ribosomal protein L37AE/L43A
MEFLLFFVLPVKAKWFGFFTAGVYLVLLFTADMGTRLSVGAALLNYLLFFGADFRTGLQAKRRRKAYEEKQVAVQEQPLHTCSVCGITDLVENAPEFRYCSECGDCFCEPHLKAHREQCG